MTSPIIYWRSKEKRYQYLDKVGRIVSFTEIFKPPFGFGKTPYLVALIKFKNNQKQIGQLVLGNKKAKIGAKVKGIIRIIGQPSDRGIINYGIKFKLI